MNTGLVLSEQAELERCESIIETGLRTFVDVGNALLTIRDKRLYRVEYGTFEDYCRERWSMSKTYAIRTMAAAEAVKLLVPIGTVVPQNEAQARPLTHLEPEQQQEVWAQVVAENPDGKITGAKVQEVVDRMAAKDSGIITCPTCGNLYDHAAFKYGCPYCYKASHGIQGWVDGLPEQMAEAARPEAARNRHIMSVMGSSESPEWYTPKGIIDLTLELFGEIDLDPCSNSHDEPNVPARRHYTRKDDGLAQEWRGRIYMNPPYGDEIPKWTEKLVQAYKTSDVQEAIALLPGRIDTQWFKPLYEFLICAIEGRLQFVNSQYSAPFPSVVVYLGDRREDFIRVFGELGPILERVD